MYRDAKDVFQDRGVYLGGGSGRRRANVELLDSLEIIPSPDVGRAPGVARPKIASDATEPGDIGELELDFIGLDQRLR